MYQPKTILLLKITDMEMSENTNDIVYKGRVVGHAYGGGNPHYHTVIYSDMVHALLLARPDDIITIRNISMTYEQFQRDRLSKAVFSVGPEILKTDVSGKPMLWD